MDLVVGPVEDENGLLKEILGEPSDFQVEMDGLELNGFTLLESQPDCLLLNGYADSSAALAALHGTNNDLEPVIVENNIPVVFERFRSDSAAAASTTHGSFIKVAGTVAKPRRSIKKVALKEQEIAAALDQSLEPAGAGTESDYSGSESDDESDELSGEEGSASKRARLEDDDRRKSGRERKVPKKFEAPVAGKDVKKRAYRRRNGENDDVDFDTSTAASSKKRKLEKKPPPRPKPPASKDDGSPKKLVRIRKRQSEVKSKRQEDSDLSEEDVSKSFKKRLKQVTKNSTVNKSGRIKERTRVKYQEEEEEHSSDIRSDLEEVDYVPLSLDVDDVDAIDYVLDHRIGKVGATGENTMYWTVKINGDPNLTLGTEDTDVQFYIKWKGWSHINNTWETEASIAGRRKGSQDVKGLRKLYNYQNKLAEFNQWKKRSSPEDVEYQEIEIEMGRQMLYSYVEAERVFASRRNEGGGKDYYVKWRNLPYSEATWEDEFNVQNYYQETLTEFEQRQACKTFPKHYADSMKNGKGRFVPMKEQPDYIGSEHFRLREYQLEGLNFLLNAWSRDNSVILADEMGLGKTIMTIAFLKYLWHNYPFKGPMLVCVPLSTMAAWQKEFEQWGPELNTVIYNGNAASRQLIRDHECFNKSGQIIFNVLLTNYEMVVKDRQHFSAIKWSNIVVDEAHRLKSEESLLYKVLVGIVSQHRLLLTGTPLQNSLKELWCLLSYIQPPGLEDWETFSQNYGTDEDKATGYIKLHTLLKPYIIRRLKKDVEKSLPGKVEQILRVDMTVRQKRLYRLVLTRNFEALAKGKNQISLLNILMQLRKTCNHADLIQEAEEAPSLNQENRLQQLIYGSGKLLLLDKLLTRFRERGDRVLIFSQMVKLLDLLEEYMNLRRYPFQRLDGSVSADRRKQSIAQFNAPNSVDFCFLLSTKAGGLGINLQTANRVIIFDSDFNPQNDLQAIARAHRIGQKEEVKIFRLVASSSVDEDIIQRAKNKMVLDHLVIQTMDTTGRTVLGTGSIGGSSLKDRQGKIQPFGKEELNLILKFGAQDLFKEEEGEQEKEVNLDAILESAEMREEEEAPQSEANRELLNAFKCTTVQFEETEKEFKIEERKDDFDWADIIPAAMVDRHKVKKGVEVYSDPEELFNPIAHRRKKRQLKRKLSSRDVAESSKEVSRANSEADDSDLSIHSDSDSDMSDGEKEIRTKLRLMERNKASYSRKTMRCLLCNKNYVDATALRNHMANFHAMPNYVIRPENRLNVPESQKESLVKRKRGVKAMNTRCFKCNKTFMHRLGYKNHLKKRHNGVEPVENLDPSNLAKPDDRIDCLICEKKFTTVVGLKLHINRLHLGQEDGGGDEGEEADEEEEAAKQSKMDEISEDDRRLIEKMYYRMRRYGCRYCPVRFNNKTKHAMHESVHAQSRKPVICPYCEKTYSRRDKLRDHIARSHDGMPMPEPSPRSGIVGVIQREVDSPEPAGFKYRLADFPSVGGQVKCPECDALFNSVGEAQLHVRDVHMEDKPVKCPVCHMAYADKKGLYQHMFRKHPRTPMDTQIVNPFVMSSLSRAPAYTPPEPEIRDETPELQPIKMADGSIKCPLCPKTYNSQGGFWIHKKNHHPDLFNSGFKSASSSVPDSKKKFWCEVCGKFYSSYTSLYIHRKNLHPSESPKPGRTSVPPVTHHKPIAPKPAPLVVNIGGGGTHTCLKCQGQFVTLRQLATHIEEVHQGAQSSGEEGGTANPRLVDCPYCISAYPRRDKLNVHIKKTHPGKPLVPADASPIKILPKPGLMGGSLTVTPVRPLVVSPAVAPAVPQELNGSLDNSFSKKTKYKEKCFKCTQCGKGYVNIARLKQHVEFRHARRNDPFADVGPNSDIVVRNHHSRSGFELFKVLCVYTTGLRLKGVKFEFDGTDAFVLTEHIDKNVSKRDIIMVLSTLRRCGERKYKMDPNEYIRLLKTVSMATVEVSENSAHSSSVASLDLQADQTQSLAITKVLPATASTQVRVENRTGQVENGDDEENGDDDEIEDDLDDEEEERFIARLEAERRTNPGYQDEGDHDDDDDGEEEEDEEEEEEEEEEEDEDDEEGEEGSDDEETPPQPSGLGGTAPHLQGRPVPPTQPPSFNGNRQ